MRTRLLAARGTAWAANSKRVTGPLARGSRISNAAHAPRFVFATLPAPAHNDRPSVAIASGPRLRTGVVRVSMRRNGRPGPRVIGRKRNSHFIRSRGNAKSDVAEKAPRKMRLESTGIRFDDAPGYDIALPAARYRIMRRWLSSDIIIIVRQRWPGPTNYCCVTHCAIESALAVRGYNASFVSPRTGRR